MPFPEVGEFEKYKSSWLFLHFQNNYNLECCFVLTTFLLFFLIISSSFPHFSSFDGSLWRDFPYFLRNFLNISCPTIFCTQFILIWKTKQQTQGNLYFHCDMVDFYLMCLMIYLKTTLFLKFCTKLTKKKKKLCKSLYSWLKIGVLLVVFCWDRKFSCVNCSFGIFRKQSNLTHPRRISGCNDHSHPEAGWEEKRKMWKIWTK